MYVTNEISTKDAAYMRFFHPSCAYQNNEPMSPTANSPIDIGKEMGMNILSKITTLDTKIHPVIP